MTDIIESIKNTKANSIYQWFQPNVLYKGLQLHNQLACRDIKLIKDNKLDVSIVLPAGVFNVILVSAKNGITGSCSCDPNHKSSLRCAHGAVAWLALFHLVNTKVFVPKALSRNALYIWQGKLLKSLNLSTSNIPNVSRESQEIDMNIKNTTDLEPNNKELVFTENIYSNMPYIQIDYYEKGKRIEVGSLNLPDFLRNIMYNLGKNIYRSYFASYISGLHIPNDCFISVIGIDKSYKDLKLNKKLKISEYLDFNQIQNKIEVQLNRYNRSSKDCQEPVVVLWNQLVIDSKKKEIFFYKQGHIAKFFTRQYNNQEETQNTAIISHLNNQNLLLGRAESLDQLLGNMRFYIQGKPIKPKIESINIVMFVKTDFTTNTASISPVFFINKEMILAPKALFSFSESIGNSGGVSMKAKFRRELFSKLLLNLLPTKKENERKALISSYFREMNFLKRADIIEMTHAVNLFLEVIEFEMQAIYAMKEGWTHISFMNRSYLAIASVMCEVFDIELALLTEEFPLVIELTKFIKHLGQIEELCRKKNIEIKYETPLVRESLQIEVDATNEGGIDWFEVRPEVFCHKAHISDQHWRKMLETGYIETELGVTILDEASLKQLSQLVTLMPTEKITSKKSKSRSDEIVPVSRLAILDWIALRKSGISVKLTPETENIFTSLMQFTHISDQPLPKTFIATLRPYQKQGVNWLWFLYTHKFGAVLADDMGLGKTVQAIGFMALLLEKKKNIQPILIIVPPTLVFNWKNEFERFFPRARILEHIGGTRNHEDFSKVDIIITSYDIARRDIIHLKKCQFEVILFDEAQAVKNIHAKRTSAIRQLNGNFKICLTGTPIENHVGEYFSILDIAVSGIFGEHKQFMSASKVEASLKRYLSRVRPFILRRTKKEILKELPDKIESDIYLTLSDHQKALYVRIVAEVRETVAIAFKYQPQQQAGIVALTALLRLRQICVASQLIIPNETEPSPKFEYLIQKLTELQEEGHSALIFSQFRKCLDLFSTALTTAGIEHLRMDGETPMVKRRGIVNSFQSGESPPFFLISLKTGGVGLNLTRASYVVHIDPWWNPSVENQAADRAHRIGQTQTVHVFRLVMKDTVEEKIMLLKKNKQKLVDQIMEGNTVSESAAITRDDFDYLLS